MAVIINGANPNVMDVAHSCRCCLRRAPDKDLKTPYTHLGDTEIYSDMLKECFEIHVILGGICEVCVGQLRDASKFKKQVLCSQADLQAWLERPKFVEGEDPPIKSEMADDDDTENDTVFYEVPIEKTEMGYGNYVETGEGMLFPMGAAAGAGAESEVARSEQVAMAGSTRLEHLRGDEAPLASQTCIEKHNINRYLCELCYKTFANMFLLKQHKIIHIKDKPFTCDVCKKQFRNKRNLIAHIKLHTRGQPYICEECGEQFSQESRLNKHKRIHTGDKIYSCDECNKQFTRKDTLDIHNKRIHAKEKPHSCDECNKQFTKKYSLDIHKRTHTGVKPYSCDICFKKFKIKHHLDLHKRIHTGHKPYSCEECNKQFTRKDNLDSHKRTHTGAKPYHCTECDKYYTCKSSLNKHNKIHTV